MALGLVWDTTKFIVQIAGGTINTYSGTKVPIRTLPGKQNSEAYTAQQMSLGSAAKLPTTKSKIHAESFVTLDILFNYSLTWFSHLQNGANKPISLHWSEDQMSYHKQGIQNSAWHVAKSQ